MIDRETGYDYQGMSELRMDIDEGDPQAIAFSKKLVKFEKSPFCLNVIIRKSP